MKTELTKIPVDKEIELIPLQINSAPEIFDTINKNRKYLREWLPFVDNTKQVKDTESFIHSVIESTCLKKDIIYEIRYKKEFSGLVALKEYDTLNKKTEIGYWLAEDKQGKGIMLRSCRALISFAFSKLGVNRIQVKCAVGNKKSIQIPFRLRFEYEGIERNGENLYGKYVDLKIYSILKKEWK